MDDGYWKIDIHTARGRWTETTITDHDVVTILSNFRDDPTQLHAVITWHDHPAGTPCECPNVLERRK